jgi:hypothetical protein
MIKAIFFLSIISYWNVIGGPPPIISKITFTEEELVIDGTQLEDTKSVSIRTLENKILKDYELDNANPEKIVARPLDGSFEPGDKNLYLVVSDSEGELFYSITLRSKTGDGAIYKITQKKKDIIPNKIVVDEKSEINFSPGDNSGRYYYNYSIYANPAGDLAIKNEDKDLFKIDQWGNLEIAGTLKVKGKTLKLFNTLNFENQLFPVLPTNHEGDFRVKDVVIGDDNNISGVINFTSSGNMDVATSTFHVDSTNGRVGIGNATPTYKLDVQGSNNSGIRLRQAAASTNTSGAFFNGMVFEDPGQVKSFGIGYGAGDLFSINSWDGSAYRNIFSLNNVGNGVISGSLKIGAYTLPAADGTNNQVLTTNGAGIASWSSPTGAGLGDVVGPASSTVDNLASFSSGTGKAIKDSGINSSNLPTMGVVATTANQIIISTGPGKQFTTTLYPISETIGASGTVLKSDGAAASWQPEVSVANFIAGPASSTLLAIPRYEDTTGKILKNSPVVMDDAGNFNFLRAVSTTAGSHPCPSMTTTQRDSLTGSDGDCVYDSNRMQTSLSRMGRWGDIPVREVWGSGQQYKKGDMIQYDPFSLTVAKDFIASTSISDDFFNNNFYFPSLMPVTTCTAEGGAVTLNGGNIDVQAGRGLIISRSTTGLAWPNETKVVWNSAASIPPANSSNWNTVYIDKDGVAHVILGKPTSLILRTEIVLALVNPGLNQIRDHRGPCFDQGNTIRDLSNILGPLVKGIEYSGNANLTMTRAPGETYSTGINFGGENPDIKSYPAEPVSNIAYYMDRDSTVATNVTNVDPNQFDTNGTLGTVTNNRWTYQRVYLVAGGITAIQYGQSQYATLNAAISGVSTDAALFVENPNLAGNAKWIATIVLQKGTTALNNTTQNKFINCGIFGCGEGGGGATGGEGGGDVFGPTSSVANNLAIFSDVTGKLIGDSGINSANLATMATATAGANQIIISAGGKVLSSTVYQIPPAIGASGTVLKSDGTNAFWQMDASSFGLGVVGPATSTMDAISTFDGTDGKTLKNTTFTIVGNHLLGANVVMGDNSGYGAGMGCFSHKNFKDDWNSAGFCQDENGNSFINTGAAYTLDLKVGGNTQVLISGGTTTNQNHFINNGNLTVDTNTFFVNAATNRVGIGTVTPVQVFQIDSTISGFLPPRMSTAEKNAINPQTPGMVIFDTDLNALNVRTSSDWMSLGIGDVVGPASASSTNLAAFSGASGKLIQDSGIIAANVVTNSAASLDNAIPRFSGTMGTTIQNSGVTIDGSNNISGILNIAVGASATINGALIINNNGANSSAFPTTRGSNGQALITNGSGALSWGSLVSAPTSTDKTGAYTIAGTDCQNTLTFTSGTTATFTVPNTLPVGCQINIVQMGTAQVSFVGTGITVTNGLSMLKTRAQFSPVTLLIVNTSYGILGGDVGN